MIFSYNLLQSFFKKKLPKPEKLAELLIAHSFEVEKIAKADNDWMLDIDVLSNRAADCFSHLGMARECAAITGLKLVIKKYSLTEDKKLKIKDLLSVAVEDKEACPRYTAQIIKGIKVGPSPKWLQQILETCGLRPINNIVDAANYVMLETGQPLHAFDLDKMRSIVVRRAVKGEKIVSLDNEKYDLDESILIIANEKAPLAIAGIKGGKEAEINEKTKNIVLESANFDTQIIRMASRKLKLKTDASLRFEHGLDPNLASFALQRLAGVIQETAKGKAVKNIVDIYPKKILPKKIKLDLTYTQKLLGIDITVKEIIAILKSLEFKIITQDQNKELMVEIPTYRLDINIPEDLIEEVGRLYGYENIEAVFPTTTLIPPQRNEELFWENNIKDILKGIGFCESYNYSFLSAEQIKAFHFEQIRVAEIKNPASIDQKYLRPSLIPNLLKNVEKNLDNFDNIKMFELGKIFSRRVGSVTEKKMLTAVIAQKRTKTEQFHQLKGIADLLLNRLGIADVWYNEYQPSTKDIWHSKKCAEIKIGDKKIGFLGEISPQFLDALKIKTKVAIVNFDFRSLKEIALEECEYRPISRFPATIRDIAILVPKTVKIIDVLNSINISGGKLVRDVDVFDIYEGISETKKNLAFHIIYQADDRTLTAKEVDEIQNNIITALEKNPEWEVRK